MFAKILNICAPLLANLNVKTITLKQNAQGHATNVKVKFRIRINLFNSNYLFSSLKEQDIHPIVIVYYSRSQ